VACRQLGRAGEPQIAECRFPNVEVAVGLDRRHFGVLRFDIRQSAVHLDAPLA
jgi:hypothetical protein